MLVCQQSGHFQEMYFDGNFYQTTDEGGYTVPDFRNIAVAYGLKYYLISDVSDIRNELFMGDYPAVIEVRIEENTYVFPKLKFGNPNCDQEPLLNRNLFDYLNTL